MAFKFLALARDEHSLEDIINSRLTLNDMTLFIPPSLMKSYIFDYSAFGQVVPIDQYFLDSAVIDVVENEYGKDAYNSLIASHEEDLIRAAQLRDMLNLPGQSYQSALAFRRKTLMKELLKQGGIEVPAFRAVQTAQDIWDFVEEHPLPLIIKPDYGTGSDGIKILKNKEDIDWYIENKLLSLRLRSIDLEIETFVSGTMYHVNGIYKGQGEGYFWPSVYAQQSICMMEGKHASSYLLAADNPLVPRLNAYAKRVLEILPTPPNTAFHLEVFLTPDDEIIFCEIASRVGGKGVRRSWKESFNIFLGQLFVQGQANCFPNSNQLLNLTPQQLTGEIWFPVREGRLLNLETECPFPWVKSYHTFLKPGDIISAEAQNIEECLCGVSLLTAATEEEMQERLNMVAQWVNKTTEWASL